MKIKVERDKGEFRKLLRSVLRDTLIAIAVLLFLFIVKSM
jgi:hypothetical protein